MNKTERIPIDLNNPNQDKYVFFDLQQDVSTYEILTLKIDQKDFYQYFNADYGVLIGRVVANNNVGVPNAKISIFIPLTDADKDVGNIVSIYPYTTPRDLNQEGKRYNLLPRVATYNQQTGTYKPKQPFGSFPIKEEIVTNSNYLDVYKKYYKYTALTNENGDYMIFGVPTGTQTVHLSVDITDIGKYSMTPESMVVNLGYSPFLFTNDNSEIKPSNDLTILPNIEVQEIAVNIIPYWGDTENFTIGITRQDFRIRAEIKSSFVIFGTSMTMGAQATIGDPTKDFSGMDGDKNYGFYFLFGRTSDGSLENNYDIRTYRPSPFDIRVFSYKTTIPVDDILNYEGSTTLNPDTDIYELSKTEYFEYNQNGDFVLSIPCNRNKVIFDEFGNETPVPENSPYGIFTDFYGMILVQYPVDLEITTSFSKKFNGPNPARTSRGYLKIPQKWGLHILDSDPENNNWRLQSFNFHANKIYSVAQFLPTKSIKSIPNADNVDHITNGSNNIGPDPSQATAINVNAIGGSIFKVAGVSYVVSGETSFDNLNNLIPIGGEEYRYDFPDNAVDVGHAAATNKYFGAQWLNLALVFPQYTWAYGSGTQRDNSVADVFFNDYKSEFFLGDNKQKIFAGLSNTKYILKGDAYQTDFIELPSIEIAKLNLIARKGINVTLYNDVFGYELLNLTPYKYRAPAGNIDGRAYNLTAWDSHASEYFTSTGSSYLFKGMYDNNCIQLLFDLNIL